MKSSPENGLMWIMREDSAPFVKRFIDLCKKTSLYTALPAHDISAPLFIIGAPRSGTTLLHQLMATHFRIGYINNFIARFWEAPHIGAYLSEKIFSIIPHSTYHSTYGRTHHIGDAHEFGYFWRRFFPNTQTDYAQTIKKENARILKTELSYLTNILHKPLLFKNLTCGLRMAPITRLFPNARFIFVKRNITDTALSILRARKKIYGNYHLWWSLRPRNIRRFQKMDYTQQIYHQIASTHEEIMNQSLQVRMPVISVSYEELCRNPQTVLSRLALHLSLKKERRLPVRGFNISTIVPANRAEENLVRFIAENPLT